jgi:hypothetical protein
VAGARRPQNPRTRRGAVRTRSRCRRLVGGERHGRHPRVGGGLRALGRRAWLHRLGMERDAGGVPRGRRRRRLRRRWRARPWRADPLVPGGPERAPVRRGDARGDDGSRLPGLRRLPRPGGDRDQPMGAHDARWPARLDERRLLGAGSVPAQPHGARRCARRSRADRQRAGTRRPNRRGRRDRGRRGVPVRRRHPFARRAASIGHRHRRRGWPSATASRTMPPRRGSRSHSSIECRRRRPTPR